MLVRSISSGFSHGVGMWRWAGERQMDGEDLQTRVSAVDRRSSARIARTFRYVYQHSTADSTERIARTLRHLYQLSTEDP